MEQNRPCVDLGADASKVGEYIKFKEMPQSTRKCECYHINFHTS